MIFTGRADVGGPRLKMALRFNLTLCTLFVRIFLLIFLNLNSFNCDVIDTTKISELEKVNFVIGIYQDAVRSGNTSRCLEDMKTLVDAVQDREIWALKLIDAYGTVPRGFVWGNNFWFSSREHCDDLNNPYEISSSQHIVREHDQRLMNSTSPYPVEFRMVYFSFTSKLQFDMKMQHKPKIEVGLCSPKSCDGSEILTYTDVYFNKRLFEVQNMLDITMKAIGTKVPTFELSFFLNTSVTVLAGIVVVIGALSFLAELMRLISLKRFRRKKVDKNNPETKSLIEKILTCFTLKDNLKMALKTDTSEGFLSVIAGIRTVICLWVIMFHVQYHSLFTISNASMFYAKLDSFILQPFIQSCFYVDVFFVISAFLLVYNFLSNDATVQAVKLNSFWENVKLFLRYFGNRYIRLTSVFGITMVASQVFYMIIDMATPFAMTTESDLYCRETWWYNLLFINNFIHQSVMCASWGWYLACEMQFFLAFLLLLFVYVKSEALAKGLFVTSALTFVVISFGYNYFYGLTFQTDVMYQTMEYLYVKPYVRINPYFGGCLMAWVLHKIKSEEVKLNKMWTNIFWTFAVGVYLITIFMSYWKTTPVWVVATIMSLGKLVFGVFVGAVIVLCQLGYGGWFTRAMSAKVFMFLNKYSFSMYMVAPIAISVIFSIKGEANRFNVVSSFEDMLLTILSAFLGSFLIVVFIEIPFQRLSKTFILKRHH